MALVVAHNTHGLLINIHVHIVLLCLLFTNNPTLTWIFGLDVSMCGLQTVTAVCMMSTLLLSDTAGHDVTTARFTCA